jgi:hypothetical protein
MGNNACLFDHHVLQLTSALDISIFGGLIASAVTNRSARQVRDVVDTKLCRRGNVSPQNVFAIV